MLGCTTLGTKVCDQEPTHDALQRVLVLYLTDIYVRQDGQDRVALATGTKEINNP